MSSTVNVQNISAQTSEKEVQDFFSFCGKITKLEITPDGETKSATVTFEKETAAKTALLLDNTQLGATNVKVSSSTSFTEDESSQFTTNAERDSDEITQEEKPRSRIIAEYLAHGYVIGDTAAQRAIDLDHKHGISSRFLNTLQSIDAKYHTTDRAKSVDQTYGVSQKANSILSGLTSYYEKASGTPTGQKLVQFYTQTSRQVQDIHAEARRLADLKKQEQGGKATCKCGSDSGVCPCSPGSCTCVDCNMSNVKTVPGDDKTTRNCGGSITNCHCAPGKCAYKDCTKSDLKAVGLDKATCDCGGNNANCSCTSSNCACNNCATADTKLVPDTQKTTCNCGGSTDNCSCTAGHCGCKSCAKSNIIAVPGSEKTTCSCGGNDKTCVCAKGQCTCTGCAK